jgi:LmbE family N-acetylglucosaminyl deacetylase
MKYIKLWVIIIGLIFIVLPVYADVQQFKIDDHERLLVLAPHPDDETLGAGGLIQQVLKKNGSVRTVVVTAGDAYVDAIIQETGNKHPSKQDYFNYGKTRLKESQKAAKVLGNGSIHLDLLGFSDGSIYSMLISHWKKTYPNKSNYTGFNYVPYSEAVDKGTAQYGKRLLDELVDIIKIIKPTIIAFPDVMEDDSDHAGLGMFSLLAVDEWLEQTKGVKPSPKLLAYLIHWQHGWPYGSSSTKIIDNSNKPLFLPNDLPLRGHIRTCITLNNQERKLKWIALLQYKTQQNYMAPFLAAFVHSNECFTQLKASDSNNIDKVVSQWQHVRKKFSSHPITRQKI